MRRRTLLAAAGAVWPGLAHGQRPPLIGVLAANAGAVSGFAEAFPRDMARLGWDRPTYRTLYPWTDDDTAQLPGLAAELVRQHARVIVAIGNPPVVAAQATTREVPIV